MDLQFRPLRRDELDIAVEWAAAEGWNPGLHDAGIFWETDPEGFIAAELDGELVGTGSIVCYNGVYGFMGFFIVRPDLRYQGLGTKLWFHRKNLLRSRLREGAAIGMDGVFDMQAWYARGGFGFSHRNLRMAGTGRSRSVDPRVEPLSNWAFSEVADYDRTCFGTDRVRFLQPWIQPREGAAFGFRSETGLGGFTVVRRCREGFKIGPLFADDSESAEALFLAASDHAAGQPLFLDVPECHPEAMALAQQQGLTEVFGCARMYEGPTPQVREERVFGITTFELG